MADKELGALSPIEALLAAALFHTVQEGNSRKVTAQQIADFVNGNYPAFIQTLLSAQSAEDVYAAIGAAPNADKLGGQSPSFYASAEAVGNALADKVPTSRTIAGHALTDDVTLDKADVGLEAVDNTSDADKPVSTAQQNALDTKIEGPASPVEPGDIVAFVNISGNAGRKATQNELKAAIGGLPIAGYISPGFNLANNATDATNDIDFPAGVVASEVVNPILMTHSAGTAQLDVAYGTGNGGRFDSAISDGTWHCFIISDGTTVSRGLSKSLDPTTQPNYPAGFSHYRRVASWLRISGALAQIIQKGDYFWHATRISDLSVFDPGTAAVTRTLSVPTGIPVLVFGKGVIVIVPASGSNTRFLLLTSLDQPNADPVSVGGTIAISTPAVPSATTHRAQGDFLVKTNTSAQIRSRVSASDSAVNIQILTEGWIDFRGMA